MTYFKQNKSQLEQKGFSLVENIYSIMFPSIQTMG